ncbi:MAG: hypothetical protein ABFE13_15400 [Phycisphaerales bacterium]
MAADRQPEARTEQGWFWQRYLQQWRQSGLSQAQYCRRHHLSAPAFGRWKGRLSAMGRPAQPAAGKKSSFVELTLGEREAPTPAGIVVYEIVLSRQPCL